MIKIKDCIINPKGEITDWDLTYWKLEFNSDPNGSWDAQVLVVNEITFVYYKQDWYISDYYRSKYPDHRVYTNTFEMLDRFIKANCGKD